LQLGNPACDRRPAGDHRFAGVLVTNRYRRLPRRRFMNVSKNRPETTNLNHQYAIRRVFIDPVLDQLSGPGSVMDSAESGNWV
jgi:hypothetical protein